MRRRSAISWTSIVEDEPSGDVSAADDAAPALPLPVSPPHDWETVLGAVRDSIAAVTRAPAVRADADARAILLRLPEIRDPEELDALLDDLRARVTAMAAERAARFRPAPPRTRPDSPAARGTSSAAGRRILRL